MLSPVIEEGENSRIPFHSLHKLISNDPEMNKEHASPLYIIETDRFMSVLQYASIEISKADIIKMAQLTNNLKSYSYLFKYDIMNEHTNEVTETREVKEIVEGIVYNKLLI